MNPNNDENKNPFEQFVNNIEKDKTVAAWRAMGECAIHLRVGMREAGAPEEEVAAVTMSFFLSLFVAGTGGGNAQA